MTDWSEEKPTIELLKATLTLPEVVEMLGMEIGSDGKIPSPYNPDERTPSCHIWDDHFYCFSTGKGGDVIDLVRAFLPELTVSQALFKLWNKALKCGKEPGDVERAAPRNLEDFSSLLASKCSGRDSEWDRRLGIPGVTLSLWGTSGVCVDEPGNLLIPHRDQEGVYGVKVRGLDGSKSAWPGSQFTKRLYQPWGWRIGNPCPYDACFIAEGESDCWALAVPLEDWAIPFALPSGANAWKDHWLEDLKGFEKVWICTDNDRAGEQARDKLTSKIGYLKAEQLRVPPMYNDAREAVSAGWRPQLS